MGHDVGYCFAVHSQDDSLTGPDGIDHLTCPVPEVTHPDLHVRQRSTQGTETRADWG